MSVFALKMLALVTMVIDHIGAVFFPQYMWIRYIGRISFPIYAFLLAEGYVHTHSKFKYGFRLFIFGLISEYPHDLALHGKLEFTSQNIMFELMLGLIAMWCVENLLNRSSIYKKICCAELLVGVAFVSTYYSVSYGIYGVALPVFYYILINQNVLAALSGALCTYLFYGIKAVRYPILGKIVRITSYNTIQLYAIGAALPIMFYNGKLGKLKLKWFFYLIYPVHFMIIYFVAKYMFNIY